ncbi:3-keto-5-aminohexanoate cleavage protein [Brachybacterium paraconglomeratum]|uniref:3-keto-5-aminohexanoate cleavage protein n=1 Tax=Brachybacterium paraconglomeratum TaxID=173362 RepID=UPI0022AF4520|nr:3-keto-5-aminohexanoate cleavage protein [Brachybacterium paraconglomeratum]MCZ4326105.1 3-keto-5-aminohexanoate cleavage protein [Brachybacterium paraconglomeratum]
MMMKACLNGARLPSAHPTLPTTPSQLAAEAVDVWAAGADAIHVHVKDAAGFDTLAAHPMAKVLEAIRTAADGLPIGVTTGAWAESDPAEGVATIRSWDALPDFASVNWHEDGADDVATALMDHGVGVEAGLWNSEAVANWARSPIRDSCQRVLIELPPEPDPTVTTRRAEDMFEAVATANDARMPVLLHGEGSSAWAALAIAAQHGLSTRIGFEDTLQLPDGRTAPSNKALLEAAWTIVRTE